MKKRPVDWVKRLNEHLRKTGGELRGITMNPDFIPPTPADILVAEANGELTPKQRIAKSILESLQAHERGELEPVRKL